MAGDLSVGELAARSGLSVSALHFYERKGLIESTRTVGNQRRYGREVLRRVALVQAGQQVGISLADIGKALAGLPAGRTPSREDWAQLSQGWANDLDERIGRLLRLRSELVNCIGCGCLSLDRCAIFNADDRLAARGAGPHLLRGTANEQE